MVRRGYQDIFSLDFRTRTKCQGCHLKMKYWRPSYSVLVLLSGEHAENISAGTGC